MIGEGNGNPLQCSCLENPRDGGAWWAAVYGVTQSWTRLRQLSSSSSSSLEKEMATHSSILAWEIPWTEEIPHFDTRGLASDNSSLITRRYFQREIMERNSQPGNFLLHMVHEFPGMCNPTGSTICVDSAQAWAGGSSSLITEPRIFFSCENTQIGRAHI